MNEQERVLEECLSAMNDWHAARAHVLMMQRGLRDAQDWEQSAAVRLGQSEQSFREFLVADRT